MNLIPWRSKQPEAVRPQESPLAALRNEMDRLFDSYVREPFGAIDWPFAGQGKWSPAVDVAEGDEEITVRAELPGLDPEDLEVTVSENQLVLTGEKKESTESTGKGYCRSESRYGAFRRCIPLSMPVDTENVEAHCTQGVLTVRLKKLRPGEPKRIDVQVR